MERHKKREWLGNSMSIHGLGGARDHFADARRAQESLYVQITSLCSPTARRRSPTDLNVLLSFPLDGQQNGRLCQGPAPDVESQGLTPFISVESLESLQQSLSVGAFQQMARDLTVSKSSAACPKAGNSNVDATVDLRLQVIQRLLEADESMSHGARQLEQCIVRHPSADGPVDDLLNILGKERAIQPWPALVHAVLRSFLGHSVVLPQRLAQASVTQAMIANKPHIIWIVADDLGFFDVPWTGTGSEIRTPHLSSLAASGLIFDSHYVQPLCTPTRAAFLTGRHPVQLGLQHGVIRDAVPDAVPAGVLMLPELLQKGGYATHAVGKWHLGFYQPRFTPERRGFDSHMGYYTGNAEYWNHTSPCWGCGNFTAIDLHYANASHWMPLLDSNDEYSTDLFGAEAVARIWKHARLHGATANSRPLFLYVAFQAVHGASSCYRAGAPPDCTRPDDDELQVPLRYELMQSHIRRPNRRRFAGMVGALDEAVANISAALKEATFFQRALLLFTTDNGAPFKHLGGDTMSNWPLRGGKAELWEGGVRAASFLAGGALPAEAVGQRSQALIAAVDWFPTLLSFANLIPAPSEDNPLYGIDVRRAIEQPTNTAKYSIRKELLHNVDQVSGRAALRVGDLKLVRNEPPSDWGPNPRLDHDESVPLLSQGPDTSWWRSLSQTRDQLFNITNDPEERHDLATNVQYSIEMTALQSKLEQLIVDLVQPVRNLPADPDARPEPVPGGQRCTPSPIGPILCQELGVWRPWQLDNFDAHALVGGTNAVTSSLWHRAKMDIDMGPTELAAIALAVCLAILPFICCCKYMRPQPKLHTHEEGKGLVSEEDKPKITAEQSGSLMRDCAIALAVAILMMIFTVTLCISPIVSNKREDSPPPSRTATASAYPSPSHQTTRINSPARSNIILFLSDDQDQMLGGGFDPDNPDAPTPMPRTRALIGHAGITGRHMFAHTPICCPSRAELLTGRYLHNLKTNPMHPTAPGEDCMHVDGRRVNNRSFAVMLQQEGYKTGLFGKYLNNWPSYVPQGWDTFMGNGGGSYVSPTFIVKGMEFAGITNGRLHTSKLRNRLGGSTYSTSVIGNASVQWISTVAGERSHPFFAYIAPKAAHEPFMPAPWYTDVWDTRWPLNEPRPQHAWNTSRAARAGFHGVARSNPMLSREAADVVTGVFKNRWRTLLSVDDLVAAVVEACSAAGILESTYFLYTSDHGFTLGELNMLMDKRHAYDYDTRVPFLARGPGIVPGSVMEAPGTLVDLAPTILMMAGVAPPGTAAADVSGNLHLVAPMDGRSLLPIMVSHESEPQLTIRSRQLMSSDAHSVWRDHVLIEHLYWNANIKCVSNCSYRSENSTDKKVFDARAAQVHALGQPGTYPGVDLWCANLTARNTCWATPDARDAWSLPRCDADCYATEDETNNFAALRYVAHDVATAPTAADWLYIECETGSQSSVDVAFLNISHRELFDSDSDRWQMDNLVAAVDAGSWRKSRKEIDATLALLHRKLHEQLQCQASQCA